MQLIVVGKGFIGRHLCRFFPEALSWGREEVNLKTGRLTASLPLGEKGYAIMAAGPNARQCEQDPKGSFQEHVWGALQVGGQFLAHGLVPLFFSSDYVFNEQFEIAPINQYGRQKVALERGALEMGGLILRLSKVYGLEKEDGTLFDEMAAQLQSGKQLRIAYDQLFSPLFIGDLLNIIRQLMEQNSRGLFTLSGPYPASRLEMAYALADKLQRPRAQIDPISLEELDDGLPRPKRLPLCSSLARLSWQDAVSQMYRLYE